jgi:hypothetical protein
VRTGLLRPEAVVVDFHRTARLDDPGHQPTRAKHPPSGLRSRVPRVDPAFATRGGRDVVVGVAGSAEPLA